MDGLIQAMNKLQDAFSVLGQSPLDLPQIAVAPRSPTRWRECVGPQADCICLCWIDSQALTYEET